MSNIEEAPQIAGRKRNRALSTVQPSPLRKKPIIETALTAYGDEDESIQGELSSTPQEEFTSDPPFLSRQQFDFFLPKVSFDLISLVDGHRKVLTASTAQCDEIFSLYPRCQSIDQEGYLIMLQFDPGFLPPKPWPVMLGGLPVFFTDSETKYPPWYGSFGRGKRIMSDWTQLNPTDISIPDKVLHEIFTIIPMATSISHFGLVLCIELETEDLEQELAYCPRMIGTHRVSYKSARSVERSQELFRSKQRRIRVVHENIDSSDYSPNLAPGIMVDGLVRDKQRGSSQRIGSTQGIALLSSESRVMILLAEHTFRSVENITDTVWHPSDTGKALGPIVSRNRNSDMAFLELHTEFNVCNHDYFDVVGSSSILQLRDKDLDATQHLVFDSPWSGPVFGCQLGYKTFRHHFYDEAVRRLNFSVFYIGNGSEDPRNGVCGATIITTDRDEESFKRGEQETAPIQYAVSQFHLYEGSGLALGSNLRSLANAGYSVPQDRVQGTASMAKGLI